MGEARANGGRGLRPGEGVLVGPPMATRREFAAAAAATAAAAAGLGRAANAWADEPASSDADASSSTDGMAASASSDADAPSSSDAAAGAAEEEEGVTNALGFTDVSDSVGFEPQATFELPLGSLVRADCAARLSVLQAHEGARPLTTVACLDATSGEVTTVLDHPITGDDWAPSECHITSDLICWVETNNATDEWKLYAAPFDGGALDVGSGDVVKLGEGDASWLPVQVAAWERYVVWQVMPDPNGAHVAESSRAWRWSLGESEGELVWESKGRFACAPAISDGTLAIAPRVNNDEGVYYGVTAVGLASGQMLDQHVLPASVRPYMVTTVGGLLAFSIEADYGYGGSFGSMGYLVGPGAGPFLSLPLEPSAQVSCVNGLYVMRSQMSYYVIDPEGQTLTRLYAASNCTDFGDYPAGGGDMKSFVTTAIVEDASTGMPANVIVRIFPLEIG